jgi:hypothetical protein
MPQDSKPMLGQNFFSPFSSKKTKKRNPFIMEESLYDLTLFYFLFNTMIICDKDEYVYGGKWSFYQNEKKKKDRLMSKHTL